MRVRGRGEVRKSMRREGGVDRRRDGGRVMEGDRRRRLYRGGGGKNERKKEIGRTKVGQEYKEERKDQRERESKMTSRKKDVLA